jgi:dedicated sortase system histidine kinase
MHTYSTESIIEGGENHNPSSLSFEHQAGSYKHYLYAIFRVRDDHIVYRNPNTIRLDRNDHLQIAIEGADKKFRRYIIATTAPGWVNAHLMPEDITNKLADKPEVRIKGEWQETADGYLLEIRIPLSMIGSRLAFAVADVDDPGHGTIKTIIGTAGTRHAEELGTVVVQSPEIEKLLKGMERSASRIWVVDGNHRVLAITGSLKNQGAIKSNATNYMQQQDSYPLASFMRPIYRFILKQPASDFKDDLSGVSRLESTEINSALEGKTATQWRRTPDQQVAILTATHPVWSGNQVIGAIAVEQTSNSILILQNRAMENLITLSLLVFFAATLALLSFASRLSSRVRKLRNEAEQAIGADGRVSGTISGSRAGDEIGDLSRSFSDLLERLGQYTRYLETMASKLSHELRTPITVVQSSLDNLELTRLDADSATYTERAREGIERLNKILTRMSEATRLEQALQQTETENFDICKVVSGCIGGYMSAYPKQSFQIKIPNHEIVIHGIPDLIAQMLDKLVSNAIDFSRAGTAIIIQLIEDNQSVTMNIINEGKPLPEAMQGSLFDSMVSIRSKSNDEPHLGLGLHIVRLITEFHHGQVSGYNRTDKQGAVFSIKLPTI